MERVIGCRLFITGIERDVYEVAEGSGTSKMTT
jgi:hypothetical protein